MTKKWLFTLICYIISGGEDQKKGLHLNFFDLLQQFYCKGEDKKVFRLIRFTVLGVENQKKDNQHCCDGSLCTELNFGISSQYYSILCNTLLLF